MSMLVEKVNADTGARRPAAGRHQPGADRRDVPGPRDPRGVRRRRRSRRRHRRCGRGRRGGRERDRLTGGAVRRSARHRARARAGDPRHVDPLRPRLRLLRLGARRAAAPRSLRPPARRDDPGRRGRAPARRRNPARASGSRRGTSSTTRIGCAPAVPPSPPVLAALRGGAPFAALARRTPSPDRPRLPLGGRAPQPALQAGPRAREGARPRGARRALRRSRRPPALRELLHCPHLTAPCPPPPTPFPTWFRLAARLRGAATLLGFALIAACLVAIFLPRQTCRARSRSSPASGASSCSRSGWASPLYPGAPRDRARRPRRTRARPLGRDQQPPSSRLPSHGTNGYGQTYAFDLIHEPDEVRLVRPPKGQGFDPPPERFPTFGQRVLAPADGRRPRAAADGSRDHRCRAHWPTLPACARGVVRARAGGCAGSCSATTWSSTRATGVVAAQGHLQSLDRGRCRATACAHGQ